MPLASSQLIGRQPIRRTDFNLPATVLQALEQLGAGVRFEAAASAPLNTRTPGWYVRQVALNSLEWAMHRQINPTVNTLTSWYPASADRLTKANQLEAAGAVHTRGLETAWKLERHVYDWGELVKTIGFFPRGIELNRPTWDWEALHTSAAGLKKEMIQRLARSIPPLVLAAPRSKEMPDYLGQAVHRSGEACFEAVLTNDEDLFIEVFPTYFLGILAIFDRLRTDVADWLPETAMSWMTEPIMDALTLSGYASVLGELHQELRAWEECKKVWSRYLSDADGRRRLEAIAAMHRFQRNQFAISPRSILRTKWQMAVGREFEALEREPSSDFFHPGPVKHPGALIRRLAPLDDLLAGMTLTDPSDLFVVQFLARLPGAEQLEFGVADWVAQRFESDDADEGTEQ